MTCPGLRATSCLCVALPLGFPISRVTQRLMRLRTNPGFWTLLPVVSMELRGVGPTTPAVDAGGSMLLPLSVLSLKAMDPVEAGLTMWLVGPALPDNLPAVPELPDSLPVVCAS